MGAIFGGAKSMKLCGMQVDTLFSRGDLNRPENGGEAFVLSVVVMMMHVERPYTFVL